MKTVSLIQGTPEWHQHRAQYRNASDAPAVMNCSPHMTRDELMHRMKTGITPDIDPATQRRFDDGHRFEALARPLAEDIVGEALYPVTGVNGKFSASFDGLNAMENVAFEHKTLNAELRAVFDAFDDLSKTKPDFRESHVGEILPLHYRVQMEHQLLVSEAERVLFMATKWDGDVLVEERHCDYDSDPKLRAALVAAWEQFERDLAAYVPPAAATPAPTGKAPESLPALLVQVTGMVTASNLPEFKAVALGAIASVNRDLQTDQDFADAEKSVKWCAEIEARIKATKEHAMSQTASIDALFRTLTEISDEAKRVRLDLDKLVKARKETIKGEIVAGGVAAFAAHIRELNAAMPAAYMPQVPTDFGGCIKNLRTVDSIRNAVNSELARAKIAASEIATRIHANVAAIKASGLVVHDAAALVLKQPDDLAAVLAQRAAAEKAKEEAQRARILAEEEARLRAKAHAEKLKAEADARDEAERKVRESAESMELVNPGAAQNAPSDLDAIEKAFDDYFQPGTVKHIGPGVVDASPAFELTAPSPAADVGARMTLGEINAALYPVSVSGDALEFFGFMPERSGASKKYRTMDLPAIRKAIARHVLDGLTA